MNKDELLSMVRGRGPMSRRHKVRLVLALSVPAMLAQLSTIAMQYIDAMMVGRLGAAASASIGLVSTTTWLFGGVCHSLSAGFAVLVAHHVGAKDCAAARRVMSLSLLVCLAAALAVSALCVAIHSRLPVWLGGEPEVLGMAADYFLVWALTVPVMQMFYFACAMLRCSGNMRVPSAMGVLMCLLDVALNLLLIPRWGVVGAALATSGAGAVVAALSMAHLLARSPELSLTGRRAPLTLDRTILRRGFRIALPMAGEHVLFCGAQIASTLIVAGLGTVAVAANAFGIVVESLCYMPGYGIGDAATALIGQSHGAGRADLIRSFGRITVALGVAVMAAAGVVMWLLAPQLMHLMTPDAMVQAASAGILRIEAWAEPMYAASIVAYCVFVGLGDTLVPCAMNLAGIWAVRIPLAWWLARTMGIDGVWLAMCVELNVRGLIFLIRMKRKRIL